MAENQPKLISYIVIILTFIGGYLYYSQGTVGDVVILKPNVSSDEYEKLKGIKVNFSAFDDPKLKSLKMFGNIPVVPDAAGKANIFSPVQ